jgi:hypothetical protein
VAIAKAAITSDFEAMMIIIVRQVAAVAAGSLFLQ